MDSRKYATLDDLAKAIGKLEAKVPSRWEVRAIALGILVASKYDVPANVENAALALLGIPVLGVALKAAWAFFVRS